MPAWPYRGCSICDNCGCRTVHWLEGWQAREYGSLAKRELSPSSLLSFLEAGGTRKEAAAAFQVSLPTIQKICAELQCNEDALNIYKGLQPLHLTALQAEILSRVTSDRLDEADLDTLVRAFNVLKKVELASEENKQKEKITGLVAYLLELEKEERIKKGVEGMIDITPIEVVPDPAKGNLMDEVTEEGLLDALP